MNRCDSYANYINRNILPFIDYERLQQSYETENKRYAKSVLYTLHEAAVKEYGSDRLICRGELEYAILPGIIRSLTTGRICLALLGIDLQSFGEHCETHFLTKHGVVMQGNIEDQKIREYMRKMYRIGYVYAYTPTVIGDIHLDTNNLPEEIKDFLSDFQNHTDALIQAAIDAEAEGANEDVWNFNQQALKKKSNVNLLQFEKWRYCYRYEAGGR